MSSIRKGFKITSIVFTVLWSVILIIMLAKIFSYRSPTADPLEIYLNKDLYKVFATVASMGVFSSGMLAVCLCKFSPNSLRILKAITLVTAVLSNLLVYLSAYSLLFVDRADALTMPIAWGVCAILCFASLVFFSSRHLLESYTEED